MRHLSAAVSFTSHETALRVMDIFLQRTSAKPDARGLSRWCRILNHHPRGESGNRLAEVSVRTALATDIHSMINLNAIPSGTGGLVSNAARARRAIHARAFVAMRKARQQLIYWVITDVQKTMTNILPSYSPTIIAFHNNHKRPPPKSPPFEV